MPVGAGRRGHWFPSETCLLLHGDEVPRERRGPFVHAHAAHTHTSHGAVVGAARAGAMSAGGLTALPRPRPPPGRPDEPRGR